jgi:hypothetical protein
MVVVLREGSTFMPIRSFVDEKLFAPELIESMAVAFNGTCASLGLVDKSDKATEVVAKTIIDLAKAGEHDPERLQSAALKFFRH